MPEIDLNVLDIGGFAPEVLKARDEAIEAGQNKNTAGSAWSGALGDYLIYNADITEPLPGSGATDAQKAQAAALASAETYLRSKYTTW